MFSVLRKTKVIFKKLFFFFFESQESREAAKNSQQRPLQLKKKILPKKSALRAEPDILGSWDDILGVP